MSSRATAEVLSKFNHNLSRNISFYNAGTMTGGCPLQLYDLEVVEEIEEKRESMARKP